MEAFSLLNYWKGGGGVNSGLGFIPQSSDSTFRYSTEPIGTTSNTTTIVTSVSATETDDDEADDDEGPFFDLQFAVPVEDEEGDEENNEGEVSDDEDGDEIKGGDSDCTGGGCEFKFMLSSCSSGEDRVDPGLDFSHSDDLFFKGQIVEEIEPPSSSSTGTEHTCSVKAPAAQLSASILKSATKLRVLMLGMKKSKLLQAKSEKSEANFGSRDSDKHKHSLTSSNSPESQQKSTVTVNIKVEEVPIISLFARDNSSRNSSTSSSSSSSSLKKQNGNESVVSDEKRFVKMQKYLKKVRPLYIRVSRRYGEKLRHSGQLTFRSSAPSTRSTTEKTNIPATKSHKPGSININIPAGLKVVRKHLGKSRSSSSATPSSPASAAVTPSSESRRRDDSLLQHEDSIQSAILHCKKSFNSSRDKDQSVLPRSVSDSSSYEK